jgi:hypothetical protein
MFLKLLDRLFYEVRFRLGKKSKISLQHEHNLSNMDTEIVFFGLVSKI